MGGEGGAAAVAGIKNRKGNPREDPVAAKRNISLVFSRQLTPGSAFRRSRG